MLHATDVHVYDWLSSDVRDYAEERCRSSHGQLLLLGQHH